MGREILSKPEQHARISRITDQQAYTDAVSDLFRGASAWLEGIKKESPAQPPEVLELMGLNAFLVAQFGFPFLQGQIHRHQDKGWRGSLFSLPHQLALAVYMARLNVASYPIKEEVINDLPDPNLAPGVWGTFMKVSGGDIVDRANLAASKVLTTARRRIEVDQRAICLPDRALNTRLAAVPFDGYDAERMPPAEVERDVLPELMKVVIDELQ